MLERVAFWARKYHLLLSFCFFLALSVFYFGHGVAFHLNKNFSGIAGDRDLYVWSFAWFPYAILHKLNIFLSQLIWAPSGVNLTRLTCLMGPALLFLPITLLFGAGVSFNICMLFSPALAAWTAYLLCFYLFSSRSSAIICGYLFGFSSYMIAQMIGHLNLVAPAFLIPLLPLFFIKYLKSELTFLKAILFLTATLVFLFLTSIEVFATCSLWCGVGFLLAFVFFSKWRSRLLKSMLVIFASYFLAMITVFPYLYYFFFGPALNIYEAGKVMEYSGDLLGFFIPDYLFQLSSPGMQQLTFMFQGNSSEWNNYIGLGSVVILIMFFCEFRKKNWAKYLIAMAILISIVLLGPALHVAGIKLFKFPWRFLFEAPILNLALPTRLGLFLSLIVGLIIAIWIKESSLRWRYKLIFMFITLLLLWPTFDQGRRPTVSKLYVPEIFSTDMYKTYISQKDNIFILVYYNDMSILPVLEWQRKTNFYFSLAAAYPMQGPAIGGSVFPSFGSPVPPAEMTREHLINIINQQKITKIIIPNATKGKEWRDLMAQVASHIVSIGEVTIYSVGGK